MSCICIGQLLLCHLNCCD